MPPPEALYDLLAHWVAGRRGNITAKGCYGGRSWRHLIILAPESSDIEAGSHEAAMDPLVQSLREPFALNVLKNGNLVLLPGAVRSLHLSEHKIFLRLFLTLRAILILQVFLGDPLKIT